MKIVDFSEKIIKWREEQEAAMSKKQYEKIDTKEPIIWGRCITIWGRC